RSDRCRHRPERGARERLGGDREGADAQGGRREGTRDREDVEVHAVRTRLEGQGRGGEEHHAVELRLLGDGGDLLTQVVELGEDGGPRARALRVTGGLDDLLAHGGQDVVDAVQAALRDGE